MPRRSSRTTKASRKFENRKFASVVNSARLETVAGSESLTGKPTLLSIQLIVVTAAVNFLATIVLLQKPCLLPRVGFSSRHYFVHSAPRGAHRVCAHTSNVTNAGLATSAKARSCNFARRYLSPSYNNGTVGRNIKSYPSRV